MSLRHYTDAFQQLAVQLPSEERTAREASLQRFTQAGFPTRKLEDWRYTDLSALTDQSYALPSPATPDLSHLHLEAATAQVFVNGGDGAFTDTGREGGAVVALNAAFARNGLDLDLGPGQSLAQPLHVLTWTGHRTSAMTHLRHRIRLGANARATVIFHHAGEGAYLTTQVTDIDLGPDAQLTLYRVQDESAGSTHLAQSDVRLARDSVLDAISIDLGDGLARHDLNVHLDAPGAQAGLYGLYAPSGRAHVDNHTRIHHRAPHCGSREFFRGVVGGSARAVFNGKVVVHEQAVKTDSETRVANLLLSKTAEVYAKPELEIYNDDVKCAHGATFGQIDEDAVYYLRARGLEADVARALLTQAFAQQVIDRITHAPLRALVTRRFLERLPQGAMLETLL